MSAASMSTRLVDLVLESDARLFHTPKGDGYISFTVEGHHEHHAIHSRGMREWLSRFCYATTNTAPASQAVSDALSALAGLALYEGPQHDVYVRVAAHDGAIYVDMGDAAWRSIAITASGWSVEATAPIRFRRSRGTLRLLDPTRGGSIDALRELVPVDDDQDFHLIIGFLMGAVSPTGPYPLLNLTGEQGAGKSTAARILRRLLDPHTAELRAEPKREEDVLIAASGAHLIAFDNLSHIEPWLSDTLCRTSTGGALTKRQLFTDGDEFSIEAIKPVMLTSVVPVVTRGDLLDRTVTVDLPVMPETSRRRESDIWRAFDVMAPGVLGALLDGAVSGLARQHEPDPDRLPRLADWAAWTYRCAPGLGWPASVILDAYRQGRQHAIAEAVSGDPVAVAVRAIGRPWTGTAAALLKLTTPPSRPPRGWPETPRGMAASLRRLAPMFRQVGIEITLGQRHGHRGERLVRIEDVEVVPGQPSASSASSAGPDLLGQSADDRADGSADGLAIVSTTVSGFPPSLLVPDGADGADDVPGLCPHKEDDHASRY